MITNFNHKIKIQTQSITHYKSNISNIDYGCLYSVDVRNAEALRI